MSLLLLLICPGFTLQLALDSGKNDVATDLLALEQELYVMEYRAKSTQVRRTHGRTHF